MKDNVKNKLSKLMPYIIILIATLAISIPLFNKNLNMYRDDGIQHICRLMGTYQSITEGQFFSVIMSNFCNGFGYSWNIFYSPLTAYLPLILKIFQVSYTNCIKVFMFIVVYLSGIAMFNFTNKVTKNKNIAVLSAILYVLAPYRLTDMYVRNALAELTSFVFIPIVFNGLYTIVNEGKKSYLLTWATVGLILTHTVITMYTAILCFIYLLINIKKLKNKQVIKNLVVNLIFIILITSFYWVPLLQHKLATSYEVFVPGRMERTEVLEYYKVKPEKLLYTPKEETFIYAIGAVNIVGIVLIILAYNKIPKEYRKINLTFLIMGICLTIMILDFFPFEKLPAILKMIQFTFRLFEFTSFFFAFVAAVNFGSLIKKFRIIDVVVFLMVSILLIIPYNEKSEYKYNDENNLWPAVNLTHETGRVHAGMASLEYLPSKAFNNKDYIVDRDNTAIITAGNAQIEGFSKNGTNMEMEVLNVEEDTTIELPYIYYLGYQIKCINTQNNSVEYLKYTESDKGFIQIDLQKTDDSYKIEVKYSGTVGMKISFVVSLISAIILICKYIIFSKKQKVS